jgi:pantoate--beta-alanine ligase
MRTIRTIAELRQALLPSRRAGRTIGLVPTMGALHEGHLSLIRRARFECDEVVVSLFVNPTQFNEASDLEAYPRDETRDAKLAATAGADHLFAPGVEEVYPHGFQTTVSVARLSEPLEGERRGQAHFDGVTTVVTKLFNMVGPDVAYFGQKDAQQAAVIGRLVRDLDLPVRIAVCPTVREPDGLARSSRNERLSALERTRATALHRALSAVAGAIAAGERDSKTVLAPARTELISTEGIELEYLELVDPQTFVPIQRIESGELLAVIAARVGATRLIDNQPINVPSTAAEAETRVAEDGKPSAAIQAGSTDTQEALECSARC